MGIKIGTPSEDLKYWGSIKDPFRVPLKDLLGFCVWGLGPKNLETPNHHNVGSSLN